MITISAKDLLLSLGNPEELKRKIYHGVEVAQKKAEEIKEEIKQAAFNSRFDREDAKRIALEIAGDEYELNEKLSQDLTDDFNIFKNSPKCRILVLSHKHYSVSIAVHFLLRTACFELHVEVANFENAFLTDDVVAKLEDAERLSKVGFGNAMIELDWRLISEIENIKSGKYDK